MIGNLFGPYRVEALLGRGGMGEVYRATDTTQDGRAVALKVLGHGLSGDPEFAARFRREAEIAARLSDPHVVPIHRYGEIDGTLFLDMQLIDGRELADLLAVEGPLAPERAVAILEQVAGALDAAHAEGLVHRDVKPSNILLTQPDGGRSEFVYLVDFGIARSAEAGSRTALTATGAVVGTLDYMAPERFLAQPAGPASDVYSLACVLHELLTGARPYPGTGYAAQVAGHLHQPPPRPSALRPGLPAALDAVVELGMAKQPAARYPTAGDLARAARSAITRHSGPAGSAPWAALTVLDTPVAPTWVPDAGGSAPLTAPPPWGASGSPPVRRGRWRVPVLVAAALVAVVAAVLVVARPTTGTDAAAPRPGAGGDAAPSGAPITERTLVGRAPGLGGAPDIADLDGTPVLVVGDVFEARVFDMATGEPIGEPIRGPQNQTATATRLDGRSIVITGDSVIRLWDLATGQPLPTTMTGHTDGVASLAVAEVGGRKVLISGGFDRTIRRWDLATAAPIGDPITVDTGEAVQSGGLIGVSVSVVRSADRPVMLASSRDAILVWDVATGTPVGVPVPSGYGPAATLELPGGTAVMTRDDSRVSMIELRTGAVVAGYEHEGSLPGLPPVLTVAAAAGRALSVESDMDVIRLRDLYSGSPVGSEMTGHEGTIMTLSTVAVGDATYLISTSTDRSIRIWDLTARAQG